MAFLDDDVLPQPGWFENITAPLVADQYDTVMGLVKLAPHLTRSWMLPIHRGRFAEISVADGSCGLVGANMAMNRSIFNKTKGYDPNLGGGGLGNQEDTLMFYQMVILGARLGHVDNAVVEHHYDVSRLKRKAWLKGAEQMGRSCAYVTHHWFHTTITLPRLRRLRKQVQLAIWRMRNRPNLDPESEGTSPAEMGLVQHIAFLDQYRIESKKPRIYKKEGCDLKQPKAGTD